METYRNGPDQILPAQSYTTYEPNGAVKLRIVPGKQYAGIIPKSVCTFMKEASEKFGDLPAFSDRRDGVWQTWTYKEYYDSVRTIAKAFLKLGLQQQKGLCIMGHNCPEWVISNFAAIFCGALPAGIYTTNTPEACRYQADNCEAQIILVNNQENLDKILSIRRFLPNLKAIIQWSGVPSDPSVLTWAELLAIGKFESDDALEDRLSRLAVNQCCMLTYTSGTTGPPKGVMISHDNITWVMQVVIRDFDYAEGKEVTLSYLPFSHLAGQIFDIYGPLYGGAHVYFAHPDALKGKLADDLKEVQPTVFLGVPRIWEKMHEKMTEAGAKANFIMRAIASWAKYHHLNYYNAILSSRKLSTLERMKTNVANKLLISKVKKAIGFSRTWLFMTGTAPLAEDLMSYFMSIDIALLEGYGMSESSALATYNLLKPGKFKLATVGKPGPDTEIKLDAVDSYRSGEGEICLKGRHVVMGYLKMKEKTEETIDEDGWLHTGDIGSFDEDGFLRITGRLKELIITAGGENIPPVLIENMVKDELPCISNCVLIGDRKKYLSMLITLKTEMNMETGMPCDELIESCVKWMNSVGSKATTASEAVRELNNAPRDYLGTAIQQGIQRYNAKAMSNAQHIQKWTVLDRDFSLPTGELTSTMKLQRKVVEKMYADVIESMYSDSLQSKL